MADRSQAGEIRIEYVPLRELQRWPRNPKDHDVGAMHQSLNRFGFVSPLLVDERTGQLVAGHGRLETLEQKRDTGETPPDRIRVAEEDGDWLVPVVRGVSFRSEAEAAAYVVADNRLTEIGGWDLQALTEILQEITSETGTLDGTGYDAETLDDLLHDLTFQPNLNPELTVKTHGAEDVDKTREKLEAQFQKERELHLVVCPECATEFYVDE